KSLLKIQKTHKILQKGKKRKKRVELITTFIIFLNKYPICFLFIYFVQMSIKSLENVDEMKGNAMMTTTKEATSENEISICSYNILAGVYARVERFQYCDKEDLKWSNRKPRLLCQLNEMSSDIVCLQEVDHEKDFHHYFASQHYDMGFVRRPGHKKDGKCLFPHAHIHSFFLK
ncbi:hypothetical protein RFI_40050, partial [Reticulomyxa filosa]